MIQRKSPRGIALVVVLVFLVLLSIFVVGFFSNSQDELTAAQSFTSEVSASQLAESAVSVVMGQVREATTRRNGAWGSQPGMIRVYRNGDAISDQPDAFFKLYSSDDMILSGGEIKAWDPTKEIPEGQAGWSNQPAFWTDLNEPVSVVLNSGPTGVSEVSRYPILDPSLEGQVEGLEFIADEDAGAANTDRKARMPVRWLYVLRDGTLTAPATISGNGLEATWREGERAPTASNPIVGRIAFWTDDETSKVNVNTAGGYSLNEIEPPNRLRDRRGNTYSEDNYPGSYWDAPRAYTRFDRGIANQADGVMDVPSLALSQPVRGEFQRYPGHPSTTSLGILFRELNSNRGGSMQNARYSLTSGQLALLSPRLQYSTGGSDNDEARSARGSNYGIDRLLSAFDSPPGLRVKRLYATVDELFFAQPNPDVAATLQKRKQSDWDLGVTNRNDSWRVLSPDHLEKMRFFLTAYSRAPEMNLWGRPRMTLWPVSRVTSEDQKRDLWNASDRLLAFCSTIGPDDGTVSGEAVKRFMFQRAQNGWANPTLEASGRNRALYDYLIGLTNGGFPGFANGSFRDKYSVTDRNDRDQILTEMFDYIRVVNLRDSTRDKQIVRDLRTASNPEGVVPSASQFQQMESYRYSPRGLVVPLLFNHNGTRGFGRFPTLSEVAIVLYHAGYRASDGKRYFLRRDIPQGVRPEADLLRAFLVLETFNPMQGFAPITTPNGNSINANKVPMVIEVENLNQFTVDGKNLGFPSTGQTSYNYSPVDFWNGRSLGGSEGFFHTMCKKGASVTFGNGPRLGTNGNIAGENPDSNDFYGLQSLAGNGDMGPDPLHPGVEIPYITAGPQLTPKPTVQLSGANLVVRFRLNNQTIRTMNVEFPAPRNPVPIPNGGQFRPIPATGNTDQFAEMRDPLSYWQTKPGGFVPTEGANPLWAANKEAMPGVGPYVATRGTGASAALPAYAKSFAGRMAWIMYNAGNSRNAESGSYTDPERHSYLINRTDKWRQILQPGDVIRSVSLSTRDLRAAALQSQRAGEASLFTPHPDYHESTLNNRPNYRAHALRAGSGSLYFDGSEFPGGAEATSFGNIAKLDSGASYVASRAADLPVTTTPRADKANETIVRRRDNALGDYDSGLGNLADGPFCNKADEGNLTFRREIFDAMGRPYVPKRFEYMHPYFDWTYEETFDTFFTPNRQVPSAVLFGSLLAGRNADWQTLCFSPNPAGDNHPGRAAGRPKDYLWLDLFTMPVVEPYAISEPFSTAGKINMNYQIVPFRNIKRTSGMRAALQPVRIPAFPAVDRRLYNGNQLAMKDGRPGNPSNLISNTAFTVPGNDYRFLVDRDETLKAFDHYISQFAQDRSKGFFKSAAEICDFYLYPREGRQALVAWDATDSGIKTWWQSMAITGDNLREKPYADLYPRLTTKSNTYCVHVRAQALRQSAPTDPANKDKHYLTWSEKRDRVVGEYRGSSIIERYIDPQDERFNPTSPTPPEKINVDTQSLDVAYRFRVLNTKRFDP